MKSRLLLLSILSILLLPAAVFAQDTASITGTVKDPSGASIAKAQVTVSSPDRGINRTTTTNSEGEYSVPALPPGSYNVTINAPGFKKYEAAGVILRVAQKARNDVTLQVGTATTEVTVEGTSVASGSCVTISLMPRLTSSPVCPRTRKTTGDIPSAAQFSSLGITTQARTRHSFSSRRNGAGIASRGRTLT